MSKEEFLKIQKCVLKVNIHCDGCKHKVKKTLQKIDGVFTTEIDGEQGKVTVSGNVDPNVLIKKLSKSGKHAQLWAAPNTPINNNSNNNNQLKNMQIEHGKGGAGNKNNQKGGGNNNNQPKQRQGGGGGGVTNPQQQLQQLQQLQQMKGFQDLKTVPPQFKDMKMMPLGQNHHPNMKAVNFDMPQDGDDFSDDEFDDDDDFNEESDENEMDDLPLNKMKQPHMAMGNGAHLMNKNHPQFMNPLKDGENGGGGKGNKGGAGPVPVNSNGVKKDGGGGGGNKNDGGKEAEGKNGNKNGGNNKSNVNGGKKGNPMMGEGNGAQLEQAMKNGFNRNMLLKNGNPQQQQQQEEYMGGLMNQERGMENERFQAMMYARPPPAVNYMYPPYAYPPPDPYTHFFSHENTSTCNLM